MKFTRTSYKTKLENYPFFDLVVEDVNGSFRLSYPFYKSFPTEKEAWLFLLKEMKKVCEKVLADKEYHLEKYYGMITVRVNTWCDNHGEGKYHKTWKNYIWLNGSHLITSCISNNYAIRFSSEYHDKDTLTKIGKKLILRHCNRFLREYETLKQHFE